MNLEEKMQGYVLQEVSIWDNNGNRQKFMPQREYLNLCEAISIAEEYGKEQRIDENKQWLLGLPLTYEGDTVKERVKNRIKELNK